MKSSLVGHDSRSRLQRLLRATCLIAGLAGLAGLVVSSSAQSAGSGSLAGTVSSEQTRNALQGAVVSIPALNRTEFTDSSGSFLLQNLPAGPVELILSYSGFNETRLPAVVRAGETVRLDAVLKPAQALLMDAFTVASVKEGSALAITQQRNASNIKNVAAMDEWGTLPTMSVGELAIRMPGISGDLDPEDGVLRNISIRGMSPEFSRMTIDGMSASAVGGNGRTATLYSFSGAMYEQIEIIAGQTPDKKADSIGGQFNLKTRSPLSMREDRRTSYNVGFRWSPSWAERTSYRADHPIHPVTSISHQQVFSVLGGHRNLGISLNASYSEVVGDKAQDRNVFQLTTEPVAFFNDYMSITGLNHRIVYGLSARADYRVSPASRFSLSAIYNEGAEPFDITAQMNAWTNATIATFDANGQPTNNGGVLPGFSANRTQIRPIAGGLPVTSSRMDLSMSKVSFYSRNPTLTFAGEHEFGRLKIDHAARFSHTAWDLNSGSNEQGGTLTLRAENIGFILDKSNLDGRVFTQTQGPSVYDAASYTANYVYTKRNRPTTITEGSANVNATYSLATRFPVLFKAGGDFTERRFNAQNRNTRQWTRVPGAPTSTAAYLPVTRFEEQHPDGRLPYYDPVAVNQELSNPALWTEDLYRPHQQLYVSRLLGVETVPAAYVMSQARIKRLTLLVGVRYEDVTFDNFTYLLKPARLQVSAAQEPDPARRAAANYAEVEQEGGYHKFFPSYHAAFDLTENFKARASWSTSYGRPTFQQLIPAFSVNETTRIITGGNPNLQAQHAKNIDLKLEYYTKNGGLFTVGAFRKDISDYIGSAVAFAKVASGADNGYDGLFDGFDIAGPRNLGSARVEGIEFDARYRLTFLPGQLKGLTASANYTQLATEGKFEGTVERTTNQIAGFIPRAGNVRLLYAYRKFGASVSMNYTGEHLWQFSATPSNNIFRKKFVTYSAGVNYRIRPNVTASIDAGNLTNEGLEYYAVYEDRLRRRFKFGTTINVGLSGTF